MLRDLDQYSDLRLIKGLGPFKKNMHPKFDFYPKNQILDAFIFITPR